MKLATDPSSGVYATALDEYRASKAALNMITVQIQKRLRSRGLWVFAFCPGFVRSNLIGEDEDAVREYGTAGDPLSLQEGFCGLCLARGMERLAGLLIRLVRFLGRWWLGWIVLNWLLKKDILYFGTIHG